MDVETFVTNGLGDNSYLVASGDEAVLIDPQRDAWRFTATAEARGWRLRHVLETHVHNDYVSGALEARSVTGAEIVVHAGAGPYAFPHRPIEPGDEVRIGDLRFVARAAPGHTFEHLAWEAHVSGRPHPEAVFTGGSLLVGSAGRSDLLGDDLAQDLARHQYRTIRSLATLPPETRILPTHGAGSFCVSTAPSAERTSTIGAELATNAALLAADEETFVRQQLGSLGRYPAYYPKMAPINRAGPPILGRLPAMPALSPAEAAASATRGAWVIDARDRAEYASGHVPGSLNIELDDGFGTYVGWIVPFAAPLVMVLPDPVDESAAAAMSQLFRIGWDTSVGHLAGGIEAWITAGNAVRSYPVAGMRELFERRVRDGEAIRVLDVRQPAEWRDDGSIPDSLQMFVADLPDRIAELPRDGELWVVCTTGHRAAIAASLIDRAGIPVRLVSRGGTVGWIERFDTVGSGTLQGV
jgi:glyoxylase-like metal-dependent hydrolase (beta-lactamase superfamily II)/rhodanese-related sulfurtransferase